MSFLHNWRRSIDNNYRRETAAEQAIIDGQDDLIDEIRELRLVIAELTGSQSVQSQYNYGLTDDQIRGIRKALKYIEED